MRRLLGMLLALGAIVSGCASGEKNAVTQAQAQEDQACQISGASPGTQAYSECRARLTQQRAASQTQTQQEGKQRDIDAKMQLGIPPTQQNPYGR
jgi:hypothetical protein